MASQEKQMEVCETCGAFLIVGDAQSRVDDHLQGKQHVGYARIKTAVDEMKVSGVLFLYVAEMTVPKDWKEFRDRYLLISHCFATKAAVSLSEYPVDSPIEYNLSRATTNSFMRVRIGIV